MLTFRAAVLLLLQLPISSASGGEPPPDPDMCCGDGRCHIPETVETCARDCCVSVRPEPKNCGNGTCDCGECEAPIGALTHVSCFACPVDCSKNSCGNGACESGEERVCLTDCGEDCPPPPPPPPPPPSSCGNGVCEPGEEIMMCRDCFVLEPCRTWTIEKDGVRGMDIQVKGEYLYAVGEMASGEDGFHCRNIWIGKYETCRGTRIWQRFFNVGGCHDRVQGVAADSSENIYIVGYTTELEEVVTKDDDGNERRTPNYTHDNIYVRKLEPDGSTDSTFAGGGTIIHDGPPERDDRGFDIVVDESGDVFGATKVLYVLGSTIIDVDRDEDVFLMRYDAESGEPFALWRDPVVINGPASGYDRGTNIALDSSGNPWITGILSSNGTRRSLFVRGYTNYGSEMSEWTYGPYPERDHIGLGIALFGDWFGVAGYHHFLEGWCQGKSAASSSLSIGGAGEDPDSSEGGSAGESTEKGKTKGAATKLGFVRAKTGRISLSGVTITSRYPVIDECSPVTSIIGLQRSPYTGAPWIGFYDTSEATKDMAQDVAFDPEGHLIVTGTRMRNNTLGLEGLDMDIWVRKLTPNLKGVGASEPTIDWEVTMNSDEEIIDEANLEVEVDGFGNIYVLGNKGASDPGEVIGTRPGTVEGIGTLWIRKYSPSGASSSP